MALALLPSILGMSGEGVQITVFTLFLFMLAVSGRPLTTVLTSSSGLEESSAVPWLFGGQV